MRNDRFTDRRDFWGKPQTKKPFSQIILSIAIFAIFLAVAVDWNWFARRSAEVSRRHVQPGTVQFDNLIAKRLEVVKGFDRKVKEGTVTAPDAVQAQNEVVAISERINLRWDDLTEHIYKSFEKFYLEHWQPPRDIPDYWKKRMADENFRRENATMHMRREYFSAMDKLPRPGTPILNGPKLFKLFLFLLKWYYLFTIPTLLVMLLNLIYAGASLAEKICFEWGKILLACCFGPIGIGCVSETANRYRRYRKLEAEFLESKPDRYALSQKEEQAIWAQVMNPVLKIEEALEFAKVNAIHKPTLACILVSVTNLSVGSFSLAGAQEKTPVQMVLVVENGQKNSKAAIETFEVKSYSDDIVKINDQLDDAEPVAYPEIPVLPLVGRIENYNWHILAQISVAKLMPRGPPQTAVREIKPLAITSSLTAKRRKGEEK